MNFQQIAQRSQCNVRFAPLNTPVLYPREVVIIGERLMARISLLFAQFGQLFANFYQLFLKGGLIFHRGKF